jgi:hypothetical protein
LQKFVLFYNYHTSVPEFIDPVFTKTSPKRSFSLNRKRAFWLVFMKTGSIISGTDFENLVLRQDTLMAAMVDTNIVDFRSFSEIINWFSEIVFQFDFVFKRGRKGSFIEKKFFAN